MEAQTEIQKPKRERKPRAKKNAEASRGVQADVVKARKPRGPAVMPSPQARANAAAQSRINRERLIASWPELALPENEDVLRDTLEGVANDDDVIAKIADFISYREDRAAARKARIDRIRADMAADELAAEKARRCLASLLEDTGRAKWEGAGHMLSIRQGKPEMIIDESLLDARFIIEKLSRLVSKSAINAAVDAGEVVRGVTFGASRTILTMR